MKKYCVMMLTCDKYSDLWPVYLGQLNKYWPDYDGPIFVNTEKGKISGTECKNELQYSKMEFEWNTPWAYRLYKCLEQLDFEYVVFLMDDFILTDFVDTDEIDKCISFMEGNKNIACFNYMPTPGKAVGESYGRYELKDCKAPFRINLQAALWRKSFLMKFIRKHENPWQFETWGNIRACRFKDEIYHICKDATPVFVYPEGGVIADERWRGEDKIELIRQAGYKLDFEKREVYHAGENRKTEIVHRNFFQKCWQVFKSLI